MNNRLIDINHANAYSEVLEILRFIPIQEYNKIPKEKLEVFERFSNKEYKFFYNPKKSLDENNVSNITKTIIAILFRDYWATTYQKQKIIAKENYDKAEIEKSKKEKYNADELFKTKISKKEQVDVAMIEYKESFFKKLLNLIRIRFFK